VSETVGPSLWAILVRVILSLVAVAGLGWWTIVSAYLYFFRCDDGCSGNEVHNWAYSEQFFVWILGCGVGLAGLVLGFTPRKGASWGCLFAAFACLVLWYGVITSGSL
jgi:hypothetical protein